MAVSCHFSSEKSSSPLLCRGNSRRGSVSRELPLLAQCGANGNHGLRFQAGQSSRRGTDVSPIAHPSPGLPLTDVLAARHPSEGRPLPDLSDARSRSRWFVVTYVSSVFRYPCIRSVPAQNRNPTHPQTNLTLYQTVTELLTAPFVAPAPPPALFESPWVTAARPLSPVVGGEGSGGWHPVRRCARQVKGGGAGARVSRGYERSPAFNPASGLVLNPALSAGHPGGHPRTPISQISCSLVRADQAALF